MILLQKISPSYDAGFDERNWIAINVSGFNNEYLALKPQSAVDNLWRYTKNSFLGDNEDFYNNEITEIFSPWSNPASHKKDGSFSNAAIQVLNYDPINKRYEINISLGTTDCLNLPPAKPQNLKMSANPGDNLIRLTWEPNRESDIALYEVSRYAPNYLGQYVWSVIATTPNSYYVDHEYYYAPDAGGWEPHYKIKARDTQNYFSTFSDEVLNRAEYIGKIPLAENNKIHYKNNLLPNYPNPFNPSTEIKYNLSEPGVVTLKIYDVLGKEIAVLVNEFQSEGRYSYHFVADNLSSGTYLYELKTKSYSARKKMLFMK